VLEHNSVTTLFQNDERLRNGKLNLPIKAENSIKLLLKSYTNLLKNKLNIKIVPVHISYDRIFEASYLANEVVSGKFSNFNFVELMQNIFKMRKGKLGKVFVKYAPEIDLGEYINSSSSLGMDELSLKLTRDLYQI